MYTARYFLNKTCSIMKPSSSRQLCTSHKLFEYSDPILLRRSEIKYSSPQTSRLTMFVQRKYLSKNMPNVNEEFRHLNYSQLNDFKNKENSLVIDVREKNELDETGTIPGSRHIPLGDIEKALGTSSEDFEKIYNFKKPDPDDHVIFSCRSGKRSLVALERALAHGFKNAKHYSGGWLDWEKNSSDQQK